MSSPVSPLQLTERTFSSFSGNEWDRFALASDGSFLGSWKVLKARRVFEHIKLFDIAAGDFGAPLKVGQCALKVTKTTVAFLDRFHLKPEHNDLRTQCFHLVVRHFGARTYQYGSQWNYESRFEIGSIPGFVHETLRDRSFHVDFVNLPDWLDFAAYRRAVSENIRREYRKASKSRPRSKPGMALPPFATSSRSPACGAT